MLSYEDRSRLPERLRVVVWNVAANDRAWAALDRLQPDICLLNEAVVPSDRSGVWSALGTRGRDGKVRRWTTAVVSKWPACTITDARPQWRQSKREVPFECSRPGSWAAAIVDTPLGRVSSVSLYGLLDELSDASVHRSLSELSPIVDDPRYNKLVLLGGDLNTGTQGTERDARFNDRERNVLERIAALGLVDCVVAKRPPGRLAECTCLHGDQCVHVRTRRDRRYPDVPYQVDYLYASARLAATLSSCEVLATDEWFEISDHAPIVADFRVASATVPR
jgi:endonuclease/exonuclease/phosphatase family metal-dependent hydrolase